MPEAADVRSSPRKGDLFMTHVSRFTGSTCVLAIGVLIASTACAAQTAPARRHAVAPPVAGPAIPITGSVKDASNGLAVQQATVSYGDQSVRTNGNGDFVLNLPTGSSASISVQHPAFAPFSKSVIAQNGVKLELALTELPSVTVKTTAGATYVVDIGTSVFAYALPFSSYIPSDNANFCKPDGSEFTPNKSEFRKIVGPATSSTLGTCCDGPLLTASAEMKTGGTTPVFFKDSCHFTEVDFGGREKSTGLFRWVKFTDVAEIDFP
jgi:hypothetical protein